MWSAVASTDHLAGSWGVAVAAALVPRRLLTGSDVTSAGRAWFADVCPGAAEGGARNRPLVRECLDWTERRPHLGGRLGAALLDRAVASAWVVPVPGLPRALGVTDAGREAFADLLGVACQAAAPWPSTSTS